MIVYRRKHPSASNLSSARNQEEFPDIDISSKKKKKKMIAKTVPEIPTIEEDKDYWKADGIVIRAISHDEILIEIQKKDIPSDFIEGSLIYHLLTFLR